MRRSSGQTFIGRDNELQQLEQAATAAREGTAATVIVEGEPGIGKTRLVNEFAGRLKDEGCLVLTGHGVDLEGGQIPYGAASEMLRDLTHQRGVDSVRAAAGAYATHLAPLHPELRTSSRDVAMDRLAVFGAVHTLLARYAEDSMVCVVADDLQWFDSASLDLLTYVAKVSAAERLFVIATVRQLAPGESQVSEQHLYQLARAGHGGCLRLGRMTEDEITELVSDVVGDTPDARVLQRVHQMADGVPLYVEELLAVDDVTTVLGEPLRMTMGTRLWGLAPAAAELLDVAAVGEGLLHSELLVQVSDLGPADFASCADELVRRGILDEDAGGYHFHHALLREVVRTNQKPGAVRALHRRWAKTLEHGHEYLGRTPRAIAIAQHWYGADEPDRAVAAAVEAGLLAIASGAAVEATTHWVRALEMWDRMGRAATAPSLDREQVLDRVVETTSHTGDWTTLDRIAEAELSKTPSADRVSRLYLRLLNGITGRARGKEHDYVVSPSDLDATVSWLLASPDRPLLFSTLMFLWWEHSETPAATFDGMHDRMDALAIAYDDRRMSHWSTRDRCKYAMLHGRAGEVLRLLQDGLDATPADDFYRRREQQAILWALRELGRWREASTIGQETLGGFSTPAAAGWAWTEIALDTARSLFELGEWETSERLLLELRPYADGSWSAGVADSTLGLIAARRGDWARASYLQELVASESLQLGAVGTLVENTVRSSLVAAEIRLGRGDGIGAWSEIRPALVALAQGTACEWVWDVIVTGIRASDLASVMSKGSGGLGDRVNLLDDAAANVHEAGDLGLAWAAEFEAHRSRVRRESDPGVLVDVVFAWERVGHEFLAASAQTRLAEVLIAHGDSQKAREALNSSAARAHRLGARPLLGEIRGIDRRCGLGIDLSFTRGVISGDHGLTPREFEVLALLADGRTNEQMAAELYISAKTASVHVSRILAKLNASNRTEAASIAHRNGLVPLN